MLTLAVFLPLLVGLVVLALPARVVRPVALGGSLASLAVAVAVTAGFDPGGTGLQAEAVVPWIPELGASYHVGVDGLSLPLILLTGVIFTAVGVYELGDRERPVAHAFLLLLMQTGLTGLFAAQDLLLFYLFFEVALVPMYFLVGLWGHEDRRYAAMKFFLYTRVGSLAMLLAFLGLYLWSEPHTFDLPTLVARQPLAAAGPVGALVLLGMLIGFGVKLPMLPLHSWLPDAHVEAPTEGSVVLAGLQLKMGAYGLLRVMLPLLPEEVARWGWWLVGLALVTMIYGALAALGQRDLKRLVAYTSISHMAYVLLAVAVAALTTDPTVRELAVTGATYQIVSHGLLTGGMFFLVGILEAHTGTRDLTELGGMLGRAPAWSGLLGLLAFGSLGLPGMSGFVAELQVIGATAGVSAVAAVVAIVGLAITTGLYLRVVGLVVLDSPRGPLPSRRPGARELGVVGALAALSVLLGVVPGPLVRLISGGATLFAGGS